MSDDEACSCCNSPVCADWLRYGHCVTCEKAEHAPTALSCPHCRSPDCAEWTRFGLGFCDQYESVFDAALAAVLAGDDPWINGTTVTR